LTPIVIGAIKELNNKVDQLETANQNLEAQNTELKEALQQLASIKEEINMMKLQSSRLED